MAAAQPEITSEKVKDFFKSMGPEGQIMEAIFQMFQNMSNDKQQTITDAGQTLNDNGVKQTADFKNSIPDEPSRYAGVDNVPDIRTPDQISANRGDFGLASA